MRTMVESDMRFEHCYRLDEDGRTPLDQKRNCWYEWTSRYSRASDRARLRYAHDRVAVLAGATPNVAGAGTGAGTGTIASPPPLSPYAPPPTLAVTASIGISGGDTVAPDRPSKWQACSDSCAKSWRGCSTTCGSVAPACSSACDDGYRLCMKACF